MATQASILRNFLAEVDWKEAVQEDADNSFTGEFMRLKRQSTKIRTDKIFPTKAADKQENVKKNRYKDIVPFDHSRVRLSLNVSSTDSDYINASFIKGVSGQNAYIATQGPLPHTVLDLWRMLWQYEVQVVVMACREFEMGRKKCERYWPLTPEDVFVCEPFIVTCESEEENGDYLTRVLNVTYQSASRTIRQLHYMNWPDHGVPDSIGPILEMLQEMHCYQEHEDVPICIHCSAGCGRTGVLCAVDYIWNLLKKQCIPENLSIFDLVQDMRTQRPSVVQTKEQYALVYRAIKFLFEHHLVAGEGTASPEQEADLAKSSISPDLSSDLSDLSDTEFESNIDSVSSNGRPVEALGLSALSALSMALPAVTKSHYDDPDAELTSVYGPEDIRLQAMADNLPQKPPLPAHTATTSDQKPPLPTHAATTFDPCSTSQATGSHHPPQKPPLPGHTATSTYDQKPPVPAHAAAAFDPCSTSQATGNHHPPASTLAQCSAHSGHVYVREEGMWDTLSQQTAHSQDPPATQAIAVTHTPPQAMQTPPVQHITHTQQRAHVDTSTTPHAQQSHAHNAVREDAGRCRRVPSDLCVTVEDPYFSPVVSPVTEASFNPPQITPVAEASFRLPQITLNDEIQQPCSLTQDTVATVFPVSDDEDAPLLPERTPESFILDPDASTRGLHASTATESDGCPSPVPPLPERTPESFELASPDAPPRSLTPPLPERTPESFILPPVDDSVTSAVPTLPDRTAESFQFPLGSGPSLPQNNRHSMLFFREVVPRGNTPRHPRCASAIFLPEDSKSLSPPHGGGVLCPAVHPMNLVMPSTTTTTATAAAAAGSPPVEQQSSQHSHSSSTSHLPEGAPPPQQPTVQPTAQPTAQPVPLLNTPLLRVGSSYEWAGPSQPRAQDPFKNRSKSVKIKGPNTVPLAVIAPHVAGPEVGLSAGPTEQPQQQGAAGNAGREGDSGKAMTRKKSWRRLIPKNKQKCTTATAPPPSQHEATSGFKFVFGHRFGKPKGPRTCPETWV
ncbi:tyrosine-protein phosphatase non-receptor type 22 isoform X2 [Engraulis encrasicolus]|uniref:tyrosine-protein phosphatase non-receptor type 22 isoform X2 n=1 Tax=Engraulis encrasicolus TaxID=184585 RepID=UPI002FD36B18